MSQSTRLLTTLRYSGTYNSKDEVAREIELKESVIKYAQDELRRLAFMTEPNKFCGDELPAHYIKEQVDYALDTIEEEMYDKIRLEILYDAWDECHNEEGLGYDHPELEHKSFIEGDFINTVSKPNKSREL